LSETVIEEYKTRVDSAIGWQFLLSAAAVGLIALLVINAFVIKYYLLVIASSLLICILMVLPKVLIEKVVICPKCGSSDVYWYRNVKCYFLWRSLDSCTVCGERLK